MKEILESCIFTRHHRRLRELGKLVTKLKITQPRPAIYLQGVAGYNENLSGARAKKNRLALTSLAFKVKIILERLVSALFFHKSNFPALFSNLFFTEKSAGNFDL